MNTSHFARLPLAAACLVLFGVSAEMAFAAPLPVTNCNDAGSGSLRSSIASAVSGDSIDIPSNLGCSKISLTTGALTIPQNVLTINGPGTSFLITGKYTTSGGISSTEQDRVINHTGTGRLTLNDLNFSKGYLLSTGNAVALGGCIYSKGPLEVQNSTISFCTAHSTNAYSAGGGIFARNGLNMSDTRLYANLADSTAGSSSGGAVAAEGYFISKYSVIGSNTAGNAMTHRGTFGGFIALTNEAAPSTTIDTIIGYTSVFGNYATQLIGAGGVVGNAGILVDNTTISGNTTSGDLGGLFLKGKSMSVTNSTVAFNTAGTTTLYAAGLELYGVDGTSQAGLNSTIASNNYVGTSGARDIKTISVTISGSNNLVFFPGATLPPDTITFTCPLLGPLANNGGIGGETHKLLGHSPAIDQGSNPLGLTSDQRGLGFTRTSGPPGVVTAVPDIGAYEVNRADEIFDNTFDAGCPLLL